MGKGAMLEYIEALTKRFIQSPSSRRLRFYQSIVPQPVIAEGSHQVTIR